MCRPAPVKENPKYVAEAAERGAEIIGAGRKAGYRLYRLECGHVQEVQLCKMRNDMFRCKTCFGNKLDAEAAERGAEIIGAGRDANYRTYRLECGHEQEIQLINMRNDVFSCQTCLELKYKDEAAEQGAEIIGAGFNANYRLYRLSCGHKQEVQLIHMRMDSFHCKTCIKNKLDADAAERGAEIIGAGRDRRYRIYKLDCGHKQEIQVGNMSSGYFCCQTCEDTYRTLPSNVYLLHIINGEHAFLKLGYAKNIDLRVSRYGLPETAIVNHVTALNFDTGSEAQEFEAVLHSCFKSEQLSNSMAKSYGMTLSGYTECYPISMLEKLQRELA